MRRLQSTMLAHHRRHRHGLTAVPLLLGAALLPAAAVPAAATVAGEPAAASISSNPPPAVVTPDAAPLRLDEVGLYAVGYALRGQPERRCPDGASGGFDDIDAAAGIACEPAGAQNGRDAFLLHPPWRNGSTGVTFQTFRIRLPAGAPAITLRGATALRADAVGKSDGVTFRVFVDGEKRLDVNRQDAAWKPFSVDLTGDAGKTVTLRFETDPGPADNSSFDFALWGGRELEFGGWKPPAAAAPPTPPPLDLRRLAPVREGGVVPPSGFTGQTTCRVVAGGAVLLRYAGADGVLEYRWSPPAGAADPFLGRLTLRAASAGKASAAVDGTMAVPLARQARLTWTDTTTAWRSARLAAGTDAATLTETYRGSGGQTATVTITGRLRGKSLVLDIACDRPGIARMDGGGWGPVLRRRIIPVPYYSGQILCLAHEGLFANAFLDWTASQASSLSGAGTQAAYGARTDGTRVPLRERLIYTAAWHLDETLPNLPNPPSPFRADLADRVVLDIWGGAFDSTRQHLTDLAGWGIAPGAALLHVWQRSGYDNALPAHVPANETQGGDTAMRALVQAGERLGYRMALHENYVDYYPNYEGFTDADIARQGDGSRVRAWYNSSTKIQSFAVKPTRILPLAKTQSPEVVRRYGSDACYLDVHSAVPPWFHVDFDVTQPGAGTFRPVWDAHRALWAYERSLRPGAGGPVFGEGSNHWYWSGYLDGVEAQFGQGWPGGQGTTAPLLADFDLLKIHPLQFNHGMGYYERWWSEGPGARRSLLDLLDQYRMQEAIFGHAAFLGGSAWSNVPLAWLEAHLLTPVTARYALSRPVGIDYRASDGAWGDATAAAKAGSDFSRARVRYENGLTLWANGGAAPLTVGGVTLPRWGWLASGAGVRAGTWLRDGIVSDYAETADGVFANARAGDDWLGQGGPQRITPSVAEFTPTGTRAFRAVYRWATQQALREDERCFVHFVRAGGAADGGEGIVFQQDHALPTPTTQWKPGQSIADGPYTIMVPADLPPGDLLWTIGLYSPSGGGRLALRGRSDGHGRTILGTLHVAAGGAVSFTPAPPAPEPPPPPVNTTGRVLDFGTVRTNGSVWIHRDGPDWVLLPLPRDRAFTLSLSSARFPRPATIRAISAADGTARTVAPAAEGGASWWRLPLTAGAREYRWSTVERRPPPPPP